MYTIDMLKGEGSPIRSRPGGIAFACLLVALPFLAGIVAAGVYYNDEVTISIQQQQLSKLDAAVVALAQAVQRKEALEKEKTQTIAMLADVRKGLNGHTQWSPVLASLTESTSDALTLIRLEAKVDMLRRRLPAREDPLRKVEVSVPARALKICVGGRHQGVSYEAVRRLQENLLAAPALGPRLDAITVSQNAGTLDGQEAVQYELNCVFKPLGP